MKTTFVIIHSKISNFFESDDQKGEISFADDIESCRNGESLFTKSLTYI
jgi:hypothetical protein